jgi:curved DNA-binding protein
MGAPDATGVAADHWAVLGLAPGADAAALKRAFRSQARRWHPDLNGNDPVAEERFKQVNEAYAVLSDPRRRQAWEAGDPDPDGGSTAQDPFATGFPSFETYLEQLFGAVRREPEPPASPRDERPEPRDEPPGSVTATESAPPPVRAATASESLVPLTPEQALKGARVTVELADGTLLEVWTPPLAGDGWRLRLPGLGSGGSDHFLQLRVVNEEGLRIDGLRVDYRLEISPAEAVLGCRVVVPTLQGPVKLTVPAGSSSGRLLRLRGRGLRDGERQGDQLVELRIVVPEEASDAELALYRRLQELALAEQ